MDDGDSNHSEAPTPPLTNNLHRPINSSSSSSSTSTLNSSSFKPHEPDFLRSVQAAFKRHRSLGTMPSSNLLPRRCLPPLRDTAKSLEVSSGLTVETKRGVVVETQEDVSVTPPSISGTLTNMFDGKYNPFGAEGNADQPAPSCKGDEVNATPREDFKNVSVAEVPKKVQFSLANNANTQGAVDEMATGMDNLSSHMDSLALTEMDWEAANQGEPSNLMAHESKHQNAAGTDADGSLRVTESSSALSTRMSAFQNQLQHLRSFLDSNHPSTQSSIVGLSCATTTSVHATSAPMPNSTTHCSGLHRDSTAVGSSAEANVNSQNIGPGDGVQVGSSSHSNRGTMDRAVTGAQASSSTADAQVEVKAVQQRNLPAQTEASNGLPQNQEQAIQEKGQRSVASSIQAPGPSLKNPSSNVKLEPPKSDKQEKAPTRKKGYDPDMFFKVSGKLYQRLGKIGSGGSSEVHKVISSDCTIYALKKIKLKGRDYATAYGFCQEILYLKKLKGKSNIIQLIDYEVTDKALLHEVLNGTITNKDNRVKDDGYIYMVLEYGEIDLAHMLSQKWKENEGSDSIMDENWLRFYWQQILLAVNTIHEERIVHSDLKPANFLLVKGSLKLIDFGIAKAIMSDTTNIQRDAQVGTLSYMSPEAFMCNESDANGNVIKCGRPSDIWSLGCILYQMVYGRTPFSEYKTFWAKFKVITDPNYEITYGPVSNIWLLDLMKKCLAWDRDKRWRIPELLKHPFLVPPLREQITPPEDRYCKAIQLVAESCADNQQATKLCCELQQLLVDPTITSEDQQSRLLLQVSSICLRLQEHITRTI